MPPIIRGTWSTRRIPGLGAAVRAERSITCRVDSRSLGSSMVPRRPASSQAMRFVVGSEIGRASSCRILAPTARERSSVGTTSGREPVAVAASRPAYDERYDDDGNDEASAAAGSERAGDLMHVARDTIDAATGSTTAPAHHGLPGPDPARWLAKHGDALFRFALLRLRDRGHAEEAVQDCLLAALRNVQTFADRSAERTWLIGILKHKIVDHLRRASRKRGREEAAVAGPAPFDERGFWRSRPERWIEDPSAALQREEFGPVLMRCLSKLPDGIASALVLRELHRMSSDEVCAILEVSPQTLWQRLHRARLGLRRCLERNWFGSSRRREGTGG